MTRRLTGLTADHCAVALVTAARIYGVEPLSVFDGRKVRYSTKVRQCVGAALLATQSAKPGLVQAIARVVALAPVRLAPVEVARAKVTVEDRITVVDALRAAGLEPRALRLIAEDSAEPALVCQTPARRPKPAYRPPEPAPTRQADVIYDKTSIKPLDLGALDALLVELCLSKGGFSCVLALTNPGGFPEWEACRAEVRAALLGWTPDWPEAAGAIEASGARLLAYSADAGGRWIHAFDFSFQTQATYEHQT